MVPKGVYSMQKAKLEEQERPHILCLHITMILLSFSGLMASAMGIALHVIRA